MTISFFHREAIYNTFRESFPGTGIPDWEIVSFINKLEDILEFAPYTQEQVEIFETAKKYEFVLKNFYETGRKVWAIKFVRQVSQPTPGLRDAKVIVDYFWAKFRTEGVVQHIPTEE